MLIMTMTDAMTGMTAGNRRRLFRRREFPRRLFREEERVRGRASGASSHLVRKYFTEKIIELKYRAVELRQVN